MQAAAIHESSLYTYMTEHHAYLEDLYEKLIAAMEADAPDVRELWNELDHGLLAHMEAEERYVLPAFARVDQETSLELLKEHGTLRARLLELGVAVDLHLMRCACSEELIRDLRAHAAREDQLLYRWADERLEEHLRAAVRRHVSAA